MNTDPEFQKEVDAEAEAMVRREAVVAAAKKKIDDQKKADYAALPWTARHPILTILAVVIAISVGYQTFFGTKLTPAEARAKCMEAARAGWGKAEHC